MKYVKYLLIVFVLLLIVLFLIATPMVKRLNFCVEQANSNIESDISNAIAQKWNKETVCMNGKLVVESMRSCYEDAEEQSFIPISFVEMLAKTIKPNFFTLSKAIELHNSSCISYPQYQVK